METLTGRFCGNPELHEAHPWKQDPTDPEPNRFCLGVHTSSQSWQLHFEEHAHHVRTLTSEALKLNLAPVAGDDSRRRENVRVRIELAKANANTALAYAVMLGPEGVEMALQRLADLLGSSNG